MSPTDEELPWHGWGFGQPTIVPGDLRVDGAGDVSLLRSGHLVICGNLTIHYCHRLASLPDILEVRGSVHIHGCPNLRGCGSVLRAGGPVRISSCAGLLALPRMILAGGPVSVVACRSLIQPAESVIAPRILFEQLALEEIGDDIQGANLVVRNCPIVCLPESTKLTNGIALWDNPCLVSIDGQIHVPNAIIRNCQELSRIGGLRVSKWLAVGGCPHLDELPGLDQCERQLELSNLPSLRMIPDDVRVSGALFVTRCPLVRRLPASMKGGGYLAIDGCEELAASVLGEPGSQSSGLLPDCGNRGALASSASIERERLSRGGWQTTVDHNLSLANCANVLRIGPEIEIHGSIELKHMSALEFLGAQCWGSKLTIEDAPSLRSISTAVHRHATVKLEDCPLLESLPANWSELESLELARCPRLTSLPEGLTCSQRLAITGCDGLHPLPEGVRTPELSVDRLFPRPGGCHVERIRWRGDVSIPIEDYWCPERISAERIDAERNAELRRALLEIHGYERYMREGAVEVLDTQPRPDTSGVAVLPGLRDGRLLRKRIRGQEPLVMVELVNSTPEPDGTRKRYLLRVPPRTRSVRGAVAWTFGLRAQRYSPAQET